MIPALAWMVAAYAVARLLNTSVLTGDRYREARLVIALVAAAIIVLMAFRIESLGSDVSF